MNQPLRFSSLHMQQSAYPSRTIYIHKDDIPRMKMPGAVVRCMFASEVPLAMLQGVAAGLVIGAAVMYICLKVL